MVYSATAHNGPVCVPLPTVAPGFRLARSVGLRPHSHASLHPQFGGPSFAAQMLIRAAKPPPQPER
jgi:hypothetical protein